MDRCHFLLTSKDRFNDPKMSKRPNLMLSVLDMSSLDFGHFFGPNSELYSFTLHLDFGINQILDIQYSDIFELFF